MFMLRFGYIVLELREKRQMESRLQRS